MDGAGHDVLVMSSHEVLKTISNPQQAAKFCDFEPINMAFVESSTSTSTISTSRFSSSKCRKRENAVSPVTKSSSFRIDDLLDKRSNLSQTISPPSPNDLVSFCPYSEKNRLPFWIPQSTSKRENKETMKKQFFSKNSGQDLQFGVSALLSSSSKSETSKQNGNYSSNEFDFLMMMPY